MFAQFANKTAVIQSKMHERIDDLEELYDNKPALCENKRQVNGIASLSRTIEIALPRVLSKIRKGYGEVQRFKTSAKGIMVPIPDYSQEIRQLSNQIMSGIKANAQDSMTKMGFVVEDLLGKQVKTFKSLLISKHLLKINLLKVQIRENFYQSIHDRFADGADKLSGRLEQQVELFQDVYQLYTFVQSRTLDAFVELNDRFEYETLWRYPTGSKLKEIIRGNSFR